VYSSYTTNNYADIFRAIVSAYLPKVCVELGVLEGYSTVAIAEGLKANHEKGEREGHLYAYDLFEKYPYRHSTQEIVQGNIDRELLTEYVTLEEADAFEVADIYEDHSVNFLHVDLSNTGAIVRRVMSDWDKKMVMGGVICFEGGTEERDNIEWMKQYDAPPIKQELETNKIIEEKYVFGTYHRFPGMTCLLKKR
jgi:hypothetical protein